MKKLLFNLLLVLILFTVAIATGLFFTSSQEVANLDDELPTLGSFAKLKSLMKDSEKNRMIYFGSFRGNDLGTIEATTADSLKSIKGSNVDFSTTNVQVNGVDESDIIKTDGEFLYQVNNGRVIITRIYPTNKMETIQTFSYEKQNFYPIEIYVDEEYLTVIGSFSDVTNQNQGIADSNIKILPYPIHQQFTKAIIYNIKDKGNIHQIREIEIEGNYISSRKIGTSLYLIANKYLDVYTIMEQNQEPALPMYRDSIHSAPDQRNSIGYDKIRYFPQAVEPNYLIVAGLDLANTKQELDIQTYLGAGQNIYASLSNLYVTITNYENQDVETKSSKTSEPIFNAITTIHKFKLKDGHITYTTRGEVPGTVLNQFSMDEANGYFRIATTTGDIWRTDEFTSKNNMYILNSNLDTVGKLENIAPGERIYSVRFMGNRAYMVTFRTVDPLFVIDLTLPTSPKILGQLKIPGYSDYLHPYDENHIIGFGKDTVELTDKNSNTTMAYYKGMKIAIFDVTDVSNPKEKFVEIIGDRGTHSDLLYNHKALLFSKDKNLLAFPVTVMEINENIKNDGFLPYGEFAFQGAYIYNIDLKDGFTLRNKITHLTEEDYQSVGHRWYDSNKNVERIIYINDALYTLSKSFIKAHDMETLMDINQIEIPQLDRFKYQY